MEETAGIDVIRKRYHELGTFLIGICINTRVGKFAWFGNVTWLFCAALQLHPDKNKHAKAEVAFKLVSEVRIASSSKFYLFKFLDLGRS